MHLMTLRNVMLYRAPQLFHCRTIDPEINIQLISEVGSLLHSGQKLQDDPIFQGYYQTASNFFHRRIRASILYRPQSQLLRQCERNYQ